MARRKIQPQVPAPFTPPPPRYSDETLREVHDTRRVGREWYADKASPKFFFIQMVIVATIVLVLVIPGVDNWIYARLSNRRTTFLVNAAVGISAVVLGIARYIMKRRTIRSERVLRGQCIHCGTALGEATATCPACGRSSAKR